PIIIGKKRDFKSYGIDLQFEDGALHKIAENASRERTGARGLVSAVERVLMKFEHTLPSTNIRHLLVTSEMVENPSAGLDAILSCPDDAEREAAFQKLMRGEEERLAGAIGQKIPEWKRSYGIDLSATRIGLIIRHALEQQTDVETAIEEIQANHQAIQEFAKQFSLRNDLDVSFTDDAVDSLTEELWREPLDPLDYLKQSLHNYDHGLKLIKEKTGKRQFIITNEGIEKPEQFLNCLIQEAYRNKCE
ncbi:MAG: hypothetical protein PHN75_17195, partial [Syntrophales bacterium]|nr:hypothetical protein [Syntrophales bacterium]